MRLFVVSDIHGSIEELLELAKKAEKADLVIALGDFEGAREAEEVEKIASELKAKFFAVPGNMDGERVLEYLEEKKASLHKKKTYFQGYCFAGLGGGKPVHTFYRCNIGELEARKVLEEILRGEKREKTIIVSHSPPAGRLGKASNGSELGLKALRERIEEFQPLLVLCGHVHESSGTEKIGKTIVLNVGAVKDGNAATVEIDGEKLEINLLKV